ncbi:2-hydroxyacyl-CoA dehydratase [Caldicellulosiruptoraceae bacterium PP1]
MRISFPYMGSTIVYKKLFEFLGHEVIMPPKPTQKTMDLGVKYSPEFACIPLKMVMGSYIEAINMGAEVLVTSGGHGPCRAGFYGDTHKLILKNLGYDNVELIILDAPQDNWKAFLQNINKLRNRLPWFKVINRVITLYKFIQKLDELEKLSQKIRPYEIQKGQTTKVWNEILNRFDKIKTKKELENTYLECKRMLEEIPIKKVNENEKIRIGIVGEIYVVMESSINFGIEELLGNLGVEVERALYLSEWVRDNLVPWSLRPKRFKDLIKKGQKYIKILIGGHAVETVGHIIDYKERGFDGIIHLMPFACLPELVTQSLIHKISKEEDIPILSLPIDEQTGKANTQTRIEAFIDLLKNRKKGIKKQLDKNERVVVA